MHLTIAHSPDADDAFMHYALAKELVDLQGLSFTHVMEDIETLNQKAKEKVYDITAMSIHAYAHLSGDYALLPSGASTGGEDYGPCVVAAAPMTLSDLEGKKVAVPGPLTSAWLAFQLAGPPVAPVFMDFKAIEDAVRRGDVAAGVLIHEGQLTFEGEGLHLVENLGAWWFQRTGTPLPLGGNTIRRDLGGEVSEKVAQVYREGIRYALDHRDEALDYALSFARGLAPDKAGTFVDMYVNERTCQWDETGMAGVRLFLKEAADKGLVPTGEVTFAGVC